VKKIGVYIFAEEYFPVYEIQYPDNDDELSEIRYKIPKDLLDEYCLAINNFANVQKRLAEFIGAKNYYFPGTVIETKK